MEEEDKIKFTFLYQAIFERRKTQYILLIFYLGVVGACASLVLNNYKPPHPNDNLIIILLFPIILIIPVHTLFWYHTLQIEKLDAKRCSIIPDLPHWQSKMGVLSVDATLLLPLIALPTLSGFLMYKENQSLFENFHFLCVFVVAVIVFLYAICVEFYGKINTKKIRAKSKKEAIGR